MGCYANRYVPGFDTYVSFGAYGGVWQVISGLEVLGKAWWVV